MLKRSRAHPAPSAPGLKGPQWVGQRPHPRRPHSSQSPGLGPSSYPEVVLADAPLLYWRLGEAAGVTAVADASGNGRTGTSNSGVTQAVPGALVIDDGAASFDGSDSEITSSYNPFSGSKTFE